MSLGNGYLGSPALENSGTGNHEVMPTSLPVGWTVPYYCSQFDFINDQTCVVIINNATRMYLRANQGFSITPKSQPIFSFIIETPNVSYNYTAEF